MSKNRVADHNPVINPKDFLSLSFPNLQEHISAAIAMLEMVLNNLEIKPVENIYRTLKLIMQMMVQAITYLEAAFFKSPSG